MEETIAEKMAKDMREVSVAEFFEKNRHLLGYENPTKSLITVVKEALDNALDATNEANILPEIYVSVKQVGIDRFKVIVEDNGPGVVEAKVPFAFGKFLYGSKFHRLRQSITGDEKILIKENGIVRSVKIGEFVDKFIKSEEGVENITSLKTETPSFDSYSYKIEWKPISHLIKHKLDGPIYKVTLETGREVKVTGDHSLFVLDTENLVVKPKETREIKEGEYVVVAKRLPNQEKKIEEINIFDYIPYEIAKKHRWYVYNLEKEVFNLVKSMGKEIKIKNHSYFYFPNINIKLRSDHLSQYEKKRMLPFYLILVLKLTKKIDLKNCFIITYQVGGKSFKFPVIIPLDSNFARFFGFWIAEGHLHNRSIVFDFGIKEKEYVNEIKKISKKIFFRDAREIVDKKKNKIRVVIGSVILFYLFKGMGIKTGAKRKEIPFFVFNLDDNIKLEFLKSLYQGDGCFIRSKKALVYTTVSKQLGIDLLFLNLMKDLFSTISFKKRKGLGKRASNIFIISTYGKELNKLWFDISSQRKSWCKYTGIPSILIKTLGRIEDLPERIRREDAKNYLRFKQNRTNEAYLTILTSAFDSRKIDVYNRNFYISQLEKSGLISRNGNFLVLTDYGKEFLWKLEKLKRIINSDFCFLKVKKIEKIKPRKKCVYDISIPNCENFISGLGGIVCHNSRGVQGLGIHGTILYAQLTTGKPVKITTSTGKDISIFELMIDVAKNEPHIISVKKEKNPNKWHGVKIELEIEGRYIEKPPSVIEYLKQTAIANPYANIIFDGPNGKIEFKRATNEIPVQPKEIKPHPYGVELGILRRMLKDTKSKNMIAFLTNEFCRVGKNSAIQICKLAKIEIKRKPQEITPEESERLHKAMQMIKLMAPPTNCLSPLSEKLIEEGLKKEIEAEYVVAVTRSPAVYRGYPFQVECGLAYGGKLPENETAKVLRFANKVPLLYHQSDCAITEAITEVDWHRYGLQQSSGSLPVGPLAILVHFASVWVPFTSEGKQAIANYPEIVKEIKLALQDAGRELASYIRQKRKARERLLRRQIFERYIPEVARAVSKLTKKDYKTILKKLEDMIKKKIDLTVEEEKIKAQEEKTEGKVKKVKQITLKEVGKIEGSEEKT